MGFVALHRAKLYCVFENIFHVVERLVSEKEAKMNKIFKVIWSKSKQCYVVVSELAKNTTGKKKIVVASILAAMIAGQAMQVEAGGSWGPSTTKGIAISAGGGITASAFGNNAIAIGGATANENGAIAIGSDTSSQQNAVSIGWGSTGSGYGALVFGTTSESAHLPTGNTGRAATATSDYAVAVGAGAQATQKYSMAFGTNTTVNGEAAVAMGYKSKASSQNAVSIGSESEASELNALAIGTNANVTKQNATAVGSGASVTGHNATAVGNDTKAKKQYDNAFGYTSTASGGAATAVGYYATASGNQTVALGSTINSTAQYATGIGYSVNSEGEGSVAIGAGTDALGVIPAKQVKATAKNAIAIGRATQATAQDATAIGTEATASNTDAVAIGRKSNASGSTSIGLGYNTKASDTNTVAIGTDVSATAESAIALGRKTTASGLSSTAVGPLANASGKYSSAFGMSTSAANEGSLALGNGASATVDNGVALGSGSKANVGSGTPGFDPHASRNDPYTNLSGNTLTSTWGAVAVGDGTNTRQIIGVAAGTNDTDAVNVAQLKALNLAFTTDGNAGDVNLTNTLSVNGDTDYIATSGGTGQLTISGKIKDISVDTNGTATASKGLANAANVAAAINDANAAQTIKYKANGTGSNSVKLSDGLNFTNGNTTTATVGVNGQVSFDLNTATKQSITDSATAVARTISLGGDTGTTTAKSLTSGNVNFGVKSGSPTYLTTTANGNDVTLTINEQAIKNAAKDASSFKVKANATAAEDVKGGDTVAFNDGDNIAITQTGKTFKIATAKNVTFDAATIGGNTTIGSTGVTTNKVTVGNISIDGTDGINAGGKAITHVGTGRVSNSSTDDGNVANIGDVKAIANNAVANLSTELGITDGTTSGTSTVNLKTEKLKVVGTGVAKTTVNGQTITVDVAKGTLTNNTTTGALTGTAGVVDANDMATAVNTAITKAVDTATGTQKLDISAGGTDSSVNLKTQKLTVAGTGAATASLTGQTITVNVAEGTLTPNTTDGTASATAGVAKAVDVAAAINNANSVLGNKITAATQSLSTLGDNKFKLTADSTSTTGQALNKSGGLSFKIAGDGDLVSTSATTDTINVTVKKGTLTNAADGSLNVTDSGVVTADNMKSVVNDAITKAVTSAKDGSAWNISTNGGTATKVSGGNTVDLINGDNIEITQDGTDGKKITVKTKKDITVDSVTAANTVKVGSAANLITLDGSTGAVSGNTFTAGNASMNTTGFHLTGGPSVTTTGIDAGNKVITNVASGGTTSTNAANIGDITKAISDLTTNLTKNTNISYTANTTTPGQTVSLKDGFNFSNGTLTTAEVAANGVVKFNVTQGSLSTDGNGNITNTAGVATTDDVKNAVNTAINKAVTNSSAAVNTLGANTFTLTGDNSTSTTGQALNKNGGLSFKVAGDGNFITTSAATDTVTVSIKQGTFGSNTDGTAKSTTNGVATTNDVANIVNTTVTNAVTKATGSQVLNITDGTNNDSINLKNDTLKVVGADGVTTAVSGKTITVGLDTATKDKINNASTATNKNISLAADTGTTSSQSLKNGDVSFAVKGATGDYISTNMNGSTVEISTKRATIDSNATTGQASVTGNDGLATAKNVADAINAATAKAVSQSAWKLAADGTTGTETISGGDTVNFKAGSNMEVSRTGKDITYKTKDNVAFTTVTAGTGANEVKLDGNTGTVTAKDITATGDVTAKNVTTSGNVTAAGTVKGDTVQGNTVKAGNVTITGGTTNTITGLSNTTWTGSTTTPDRAATEGQLQQAISSATSSATFKFDGDNNSQQTMNLQNGTFKVTGDTMITTNATSAGIGLSLNTNNVKIAYAANGLNGQTTSIASGFNFTDGNHTKATVGASGVVKYDAKTSTISVANGHATASGNDLATADNVADAINQMTQNNSGNTTQLRQDISKVATETQRVGAHAAAMAALKPIQYDPLAPTQIMAGVGNYRGESAAALGIAHYTNDNTMFNVGVSVGGNHNMINAGVTHKFGISAEKKNIPDRYKAGPISSIYVMQDEMTQLRSENEAYKAKLDKQQSEIDALKAAVDQLLASKA